MIALGLSINRRSVQTNDPETAKGPNGPFLIGVLGTTLPGLRA